MAEDKTYETTFEDGSAITSYMATGYAEGFEETNNQRDIVRAWSYLIGTGTCWSLQGWFGRNATAFIEEGLINKAGIVDWDLVNDRLCIEDE